jgi:predicted nucleic acid-binding protein
MNRCVADTNTIIYYLNQVGGDDFRRRFEKMVYDGIVISIISRIEVLGWPGYSSNSIGLKDAEDLLSTLREEPLTESVIQATIALRRSYRLKVPDAIVAATAHILDLPLVSRNTDDFKRVPNLMLLDPFIN